MKNYSVFDKIKRIKPISIILSLLSPGFGKCEKCGLTWNFCNYKVVNYSDSGGTFATCDYCWDHSTLEQLKIYYTKTYNKQRISCDAHIYTMDHSLKELLDAVENEYFKNSEEKRIRYNRKIKMNKILKK